MTSAALFILGFGLGAQVVFRLVKEIGLMRREIARLRKAVPPRGEKGRFAKGGEV